LAGAAEVTPSGIKTGFVVEESSTGCFRSGVVKPAFGGDAGDGAVETVSGRGSTDSRVGGASCGGLACDCFEAASANGATDFAGHSALAFR